MHNLTNKYARSYYLIFIMQFEKVFSPVHRNKIWNFAYSYHILSNCFGPRLPKRSSKASGNACTLIKQYQYWRPEHSSNRPISTLQRMCTKENFDLFWTSFETLRWIQCRLALVKHSKSLKSGLDKTTIPQKLKSITVSNKFRSLICR